MILLDTDHASVLRYPEHPRCAALKARLEASPEQPVVLSAVTVEEQMRGWLAEMGRRKDVFEQAVVYERLIAFVRFLAEWEILPFDDLAAQRFSELRRQRLRVGTPDLKIASIALVRGALLLSANVRDFEQVPGLRLANWLV